MELSSDALANILFGKTANAFTHPESPVKALIDSNDARLQVNLILVFFLHILKSDF